MRNHRRSYGLLLPSLFGIAAGLVARAGAADAAAPAPASRSRVTIRGSGNTISIERTEGAASHLLTRGIAPSEVLAQAIGMKEAGTSDAALVGYLKAHAAELPGFVDFDTVSRLRGAGAGRSVMAYLTTVAAVEIGPTGAVGGPSEESAPVAPPESETSNELPASLGYGVVIGGGGGRGFRHRAFGRAHPFATGSPGRPPMHPRAIPPTSRLPHTPFFRR